MTVIRWTIAAALTVGALVLWTRSFHDEIVVREADDLVAHYQTTCEHPLRTALSRRPDGGWFAYAPNTGVTLWSNGPECTTPARVRSTLGAGLALAAAALVAIPPLRARLHHRTGE
jgi:hypothetical protein